MIRLSAFFLILLSSCSGSKSIKDFSRPCIIAWNEDPLNSYELILSEDKKFHYTISVTENNRKKTGTHTGTYRLSGDSIWLSYRNNRRTVALRSYLTWEISNTYLIQHFENSDKRIFLRKQKTGHWF